jgi:hypothetical protein
MMMSYDAGAGWWTFIISTPSNILGTTDGRNLTVQFWLNAVADSTAPSAYITFNKYYFKQSVKFTLDFHRCCWCILFIEMEV